MNYNISINGQTAALKLRGKFTFNNNTEFKNILAVVDERPEIHQVNVKLEEVEFIDSAGLGMLMILKEKCENKNIGLTLCNPKGQVEKVFKISKFYDMFAIDG